MGRVRPFVKKDKTKHLDEDGFEGFLHREHRSKRGRSKSYNWERDHRIEKSKKIHKDRKRKNWDRD